MDLSKVKEKQRMEKEEQPQKELIWPDAYYADTDAKKRKASLEEAVKRGLEPEENRIRRMLWEKRYGVKEGVDQMLAAWINLNYFANIVKSDRMARWHKKEQRQIVDSFCFEMVRKEGETAKELLYLEVYHMLDFYMELCKTDKKYSGLILGLGSMSQDKVIRKIAGEIYKVGYQVPPVLSGIAEYEIVRKAAIDCFSAKFPNYEDYLIHLIEHHGEEPL